MPLNPLRSPLSTLAGVLLGLLLSACGSLSKMEDKLASPLQVYKADIAQGNIVTQDQLDQIKLGMSRQQVQNILGSPSVTDPFHADRWDYPYRFKRAGQVVATKNLSLIFSGDSLKSMEGEAWKDVQSLPNWNP